MASSSAPAAQAQAQAQDENITALKDKLYRACLESPLVSEGFHQRELLEFGIIPDDDLQILLKVAQTLVNEKLFWVFENQDGPGWNIRSVEDAKKYRKLDKEEEMVYGHIDTSGAEGIWIKQLRTKTGLHDALFKAALKRLETKDYVKSIVNVENPTRKVYIKTTIQPSERATGGSWYTDNKLDEEFIDMLMNVLYKYIHSKSFYRSSLSTFNKMKQPKKRITPEEAKSARNKALSQPEVDPDFEARREYSRLLPMPPGYQNYPTLSELTLYIENSPITSETLPPSDIQQLLDILIFDDRIEQVIAGREGVSYKAVRKSFREAQMENEGNVGGRSNALTEAPCGRCPVFDLCEEGGPVGPSNCEYFETWLGF